MNTSPSRDAARPHGRRRATGRPTDLARVAAAAGLKQGRAFDRFTNRSAVVALSLGLVAVAGGGVAATAASNDAARTASVSAAQLPQAIQAEEKATLIADAQAQADARVQAAAETAAAEKAAAEKAAAEQAAAAQAAAEKAAADKAAAEKAAAEKAAAEKAALAAQPVNDPAGAKAYAASRLAAYGWGQDQMRSLEILWEKESNWKTTATNPSSGAYGIVQSLPGSKMASAGADWQTNYRTQIEWGLQYIKERYGSPSNALGFHYANNWY